MLLSPFWDSMTRPQHRITRDQSDSTMLPPKLFYAYSYCLRRFTEPESEKLVLDNKNVQWDKRQSPKKPDKCLYLSELTLIIQRITVMPIRIHENRASRSKPNKSDKGSKKNFVSEIQRLHLPPDELFFFIRIPLILIFVGNYESECTGIVYRAGDVTCDEDEWPLRRTAPLLGSGNTLNQKLTCVLGRHGRNRRKIIKKLCAMRQMWQLFRCSDAHFFDELFRNSHSNTCNHFLECFTMLFIFVLQVFFCLV